MEEENQVNNPGKLVNCDMCRTRVSHEYVRGPVRLECEWGDVRWGICPRERKYTMCLLAAILGFWQVH